MIYSMSHATALSPNQNRGLFTRGYILGSKNGVPRKLRNGEIMLREFGIRHVTFERSYCRVFASATSANQAGEISKAACLTLWGLCNDAPCEGQESNTGKVHYSRMRKSV